MERMAARPGSQAFHKTMEAPDDLARLFERPDDLQTPDEIADVDDLRSHSHAGSAPRGLERLECVAINTAIWTHRGNLSQVARDLRVSRSTLYLKMKKYGLESILYDVRRGL